jgi:hypothetical protein
MPRKTMRKMKRQINQSTIKSREILKHNADNESNPCRVAATFNAISDTQI